MTWSNLLLWSAQIAALVAAGWLVSCLFRLRHPGGRLLYLQILLLTCLALPAVEPWKQSLIVIPAVPESVATGPAVPIAPAPSRLHLADAALAVLAAGMFLRTGWLLLGLARLRGYRRRSRELAPLPPAVEKVRRELGIYPAMAVSDEITGPVTFGVRDPIVLFPAGFPDFDPALQEALASHELLHVQRRDWLFTALEELIRAVFWFHPAVWWLLGQIQLAREQTVDRAAIAHTATRERYVDALLALSGARQQLDLLPAPLFLRRRHLNRRVAAIVKEVKMSKARLYATLAASFGGLALAGWLVAVAIPLAAAPQVLSDSPGVTVSGVDRLIHRAPVEYPKDALEKGVEGTVALDVQVAGNGTVADAAVVSGPLELRKAALASVLQWHFLKDAAGRQRVSIEFKAPAAQQPAADAAPQEGAERARKEERVLTALTAVAQRQAAVAESAQRPTAPLAPATAGGGMLVKGVVFEGVEPAAADELRRLLPSVESQALSADAMNDQLGILRSFDEHLRLGVVPAEGGVNLRISLAGRPSASDPSRIRVGGGVQAARLVKQTRPVYPPEAKAAGISGVVQMQAIIAKDGAIANLSVVSGDPMLVPAAMDAVRQWLYQPTLLNGQPVEVVTQIDVNFALNQ